MKKPPLVIYFQHFKILLITIVFVDVFETEGLLLDIPQDHMDVTIVSHKLENIY